MTRLLLAAASVLLAASAHAQGASIQLRLNGTITATGTTVTDEAAIVRFLPTAEPGFDPNDASKLLPFASEYAIIAPVIERNGAPYRLSVNSLPDGSPGVLTAPVLVPIDFFTTSAGQFSIGLRAQSVVPAGWNVYLRDYTTGSVARLRGTAVYAFSSPASSDFAGRFQLVITPAGVVGQPDVADRAGWRLLSAPVDGLTVGALAAVNLVQGVPAGGGNPQPQYPDAGPNLLTAYVGPTAAPAYTAAPSTGFVVEPGRGFFWRFYDEAITPAPTQAGGGTSVSHDLRGFVLSATGAAPTADVTRVFPRTADDFVLAGNPFESSFALSGLSATGGALGTVVYVYDPDGPGNAPTYRALFQSAPMSGAADIVAPWQGFFATVSGVAAGSAPALIYAAGATVAADATFYGRPAVGVPDALAVRLTLTGTTDAGARVADEAAWIRLRDGAVREWDRDDAAKLVPLADPVALIAPVGARVGDAARQGVLSLPVAPATVPLAFTTTSGGRFELRWDEARIPAGWTASLRDLATGAVVDLQASEAYAFDAAATAATAWTERFELRLASTIVAAEPDADAQLEVGVPTPNPTAGVSRIAVRAARSGRIVTVVVDALGRTVRVAFDAEVAAGAQVQIAVDASGLAPGAYSVRVSGPGLTATRRLVVVR